MPSIQTNPSMHRTTVPHSVGTSDTNPEIEAANQLAIKKATSLPHFNQSTAAMLSREEDIENQRRQKRRVVNQQLFEDSLQNIFKGLEGVNAGSQSPESKQALKGARCSGPDLVKSDMRQMLLMAANLSLTVFAQTADAKCKASQIMTDSQCEIRNQKVKEYQQQLQKRIEAAKKARKMGIISCVIDWVVGAAEAAYGLFKLVEGVAEAVASFGADPNAYASIVAGSAYTLAGAAGLMKAMAETLKLTGVNPKACDKIAQVAGWVQLGCEMVGLATDIFGAGLAFKAATGAAKGAAEAATRLAEEAVTKAVTEAATQAGEAGAVEMTELGVNTAAKTIEEVAEEVAEKAAEEIGSSVVQKITSEATQETMENAAKSVTKTILGRAWKRITESFGKDAMKTVIKQSLKESMEDAAKQAKKGVQRSVERIINDMKRKIAKRIMYTCMKTFVRASFLSAVYGTGQGGSQVVKGTNVRIQSKFRALIETLVLQEGLMGLLDQELDESKKEENKQIKDVMNKSATSLQNAKDTIEMFGMTSVKVAINIAR